MFFMLLFILKIQTNMRMISNYSTLKFCTENEFVGYDSKMFIVVQRVGLLAMAVRCLLWFRDWVCWLWQ